MNAVLHYLAEFQSLLVGLVGFGGVIWTLRSNAKLARQQHERQAELAQDHHARQIAHEANMLRVALRSELELIKDNYKARVEHIDRARQNRKDECPVALDVMTDTYGKLLDKIGLLSEDEVQATMHVYLHVKRTAATLAWMQQDNMPGYASVPEDLFSAAQRWHTEDLPKIDAALAALDKL